MAIDVADTEPAPRDDAAHALALVIEYGKAWRAYNAAATAYMIKYPGAHRVPESELGEEWETEVRPLLDKLHAVRRELDALAEEVSK